MAKKTYTKKNKTGCCPMFSSRDWDGSSVTWKNKKFVKDSTICLMHIPLNMGRMMKRVVEKIESSKAGVPVSEWLMLSYDPSPWKGEHYIAVAKKVSDAENVTFSGTFLTKVFEGPYKEAKNWYDQMGEYVKSKGKMAKKIYFFYTTCPKCAKVYGKNYVVGLAKV